MHILVLPSWYPTENDPIHGSFFAEQARALAGHGHRVSVISYCKSPEKGCSVAVNRQGDLTEYAIHYRPVRFHLTFFRLTAAMWRIVRTRMGPDRPDIIHVHAYQAMKYARALRALTGIPYVVTEHVSWFARGIVSDRDRRDASRGYRAADALIAVSEGLRDTIRPLCGDREIRVIPNLVSARFFRGGLRREPGETFGFISVGNLDRVKGFDVLLRAFAAVAGEGVKASLTICGAGPEAEPLRSLAGELGLEDRVTFTGPVSREEIRRRLLENQAFVLASRTETFGVVLIEAMACGLPIVMTKTGAWRQLARPETGLAVETEDVEALAAAMLDVVRNYDRYDPAAISQGCRERFSEEAVCRRLEAVYREVLQK